MDALARDLNIPEWNNSPIAQPRRKMTVDAIGWTNLGPSLYAHYFRGPTEVKSVKLGALTGDCTDLKKRVRQFPFKNVKPGRWTVYFSTTASLRQAQRRATDRLPRPRTQVALDAVGERVSRDRGSPTALGG